MSVSADRKQIAVFINALLRYASDGVHISLRSFLEGQNRPYKIEPVKVNGAGAEGIIAPAFAMAGHAASFPLNTVFCPPIAGFSSATQAREVDLAEAYALSVECDAHAVTARAKLEGLLGPPTVVVASGGEWVDPDTGEVEPKLHLHWRLTEPATGAALATLKAARRAATALVGGDPSNVPAVHPIRWPGSVHRKGEPRLAQIIALNEAAEIELGDAAELLAVRVESAAQERQTAGEAADGDWATLAHDLLTGDGLHEATTRLAAKMAACGVPGGAAVEMLRGFMRASAAPRDARWETRFADLPRCVSSAEAKFRRQPTVISNLPPAPTDPDSSAELPSHLLSPAGLVGSIAKWILATARYPQPGLALGAALAVMGTCAGRKYAGPTSSGTHLYILALAPTGAGKNHAPKMAKKLMQAAGLGETNGPREFNSASAIWQQLGRKPGIICWADEFGAYLAKLTGRGASGHERHVSAVLRTLWGESFSEVNPPAWADSTTRAAPQPVYAPSLSIYGTSVADELYTALSSADVANGFLNRFLVISTAVRAEEVEPALDEFSVPPRALTEALAQIFNANLDDYSLATLHNGKVDQPRVRVPWASDEVKAAYKSFRRELERREENAALLTRTAEMAVRIATILAIGDGAQTSGVTMEHWSWARDLALWSAERMIVGAAEHMAENEDQKRQKMVLRFIREAPGGVIGRAELTRKIDGRIAAPVVKGIMDTLQDAELIEKALRGTKGRAAEVWRAL